MTGRTRSLLCVLVLALAPVLLLWTSLLTGKVYMPFDVAEWAPVRTMLDERAVAELARDANHDSTEVTLTFRPEWKFAAQEVRSGRLPEWNPYARVGAPLLATSVVGLLYPPNWILYLLEDPAHGFGWLAWFAFVVAGVGMFGFLRALDLPRAAALFGGLAFQLGTTLTANAHFYQRLNALVWLPAMLWAIHALARGAGVRRRRGIVGLALATFCTWTAGFAPYAAPATLVAGLYLLSLALAEARCGGSRGARNALGAGATGFGLGFLLASVQLLPMFAFFPESNRNPHPSPDAIASQGFDPLGLAGYVMPAPYGEPGRTTELPYEKSPFVWWLDSRRGWSDGKPFAPPNYNSIEYSVFPGTLVLCLALLALLTKRSPLRAFAGGTLLALHLLANGGAWLSGVLRLPGFESVPPMRWVGPASVLVAALGAVGFAGLARAGNRRRTTAVVAAALALVTGAFWIVLRGTTPDGLFAWIGPDIVAKYRALQPDASLAMARGILGPYLGSGLAQMTANLGYAALAFALAAGWLALAGRARLPWLAALGLVATTAELLAIGEPHNRGRVLHPDADTAVHAFLRAERTRHAREGGITVARAGYARDPVTGKQTPTLPFQLPPCTLVPERIRDLHIYTFVDGRSHRCFRELYGEGHMHREFWPLALLDDDRLSLPFFDLLGVRYLLATQPLEHAGRRVGPEWKGPGGEFFVYERASALPRAFFAAGLREVPDEESVVRELVKRDFAPRATVLTTPAERASWEGVAFDAKAAAREVAFTLDENNHVVLAVGDGPPGLLVLSDACLSGWSATVAGVPTPIRRGNLFCRVIPVPAGACTVDLRYRTPRLLGGAVLSALAGLVLLLLWLRPRVQASAQ